MDNGVLIQGLIVICMGFPLFYFGYIIYKKSSIAKLCRGSYAVIFRGPDKAWVRLLPAKNGLIQKPEGKYLLKKERKINFSWPQGGYVVPKDTNIPYIMWPLTGSDSVKSPVGLLVYDIGNPMPRQSEGIDALGRNHSSPIDPDTIDAINDARIAREIFVDIPDELRKEAKKGGKITDLVPWIAIIGIGIILVLVFMMYTNMNTMSGDLNNIKSGLGY